MARLPDYQRADMITAALGLQYGTDYGRKFYGDANFELLQYTLNSFPKVQSLAELSDALDDASSRLPRDFVRNASNVITSIRRLARCKARHFTSSSRQRN